MDTNNESWNCLYIKWCGVQYVANLSWIREIKQKIDDKLSWSAAV